MKKKDIIKPEVVTDSQRFEKLEEVVKRWIGFSNVTYNALYGKTELPPDVFSYRFSTVGKATLHVDFHPESEEENQSGVFILEQEGTDELYPPQVVIETMMNFIVDCVGDRTQFAKIAPKFEKIFKDMEVTTTNLKWWICNDEAITTFKKVVEKERPANTEDRECWLKYLYPNLRLDDDFPDLDYTIDYPEELKEIREEFEKLDVYAPYRNYDRENMYCLIINRVTKKSHVVPAFTEDGYDEIVDYQTSPDLKKDYKVVPFYKGTHIPFFKRIILRIKWLMSWRKRKKLRERLVKFFKMKNAERLGDVLNNEHIQDCLQKVVVNIPEISDEEAEELLQDLQEDVGFHIASPKFSNKPVPIPGFESMEDTLDAIDQAILNGEVEFGDDGSDKYLERLVKEAETDYTQDGLDDYELTDEDIKAAEEYIEKLKAREKKK